jgi:hypothetical protein
MLFNLFGYRLIFNFVQKANEAQLHLQLDNDWYNEAELVSIKTPLNLPYYLNSVEFEKISGSIEIEGVEYEYVKRRVYNDSLELLCLPDKRQEKLKNAEVDFTKMTAEVPGSSNTKKNAASKIMLPEYCDVTPQYGISISGVVTNKYYSFNTTLSVRNFSTKQDKPPEDKQLLS